ncbi:MAG: ABC transporter permease, partial [Miltoncostaeaceae bacterium]
MTVAGAVRFWSRNATVGRKTILTTLGPRFVEAIAYLAIMGLGLGAYLTSIDGVSYVAFIAPGIAASAVMFGAILETSYNAFVRIHVRRVFEAAVTTPLSVGDVVVGEYLWGATRGTIYGVVFMIVMAPFGLIDSWWALLTPPVFLIGALTFAVIGMAYTAFTSNIEHFNIFWTGVMTPMFLFG